MSETALVTGGAGFIGGHLVERLLGEGFEVRVLDDLSTGLRCNLESVEDHIEFVEGDIRDASLCRQAASGTRWIFHEAAV